LPEGIEEMKRGEMCILLLNSQMKIGLRFRGGYLRRIKTIQRAERVAEDAY